MPERCHSWLGGFYIYSARRLTVTLFVTAGNWPCSVSVFNKERLQILLSVGEKESIFQSILAVGFNISFLRRRKQRSLQLLLRRPSRQGQIHRDEQSWVLEGKKNTWRYLQLLSPTSKSLSSSGHTPHRIRTPLPAFPNLLKVNLSLLSAGIYPSTAFYLWNTFDSTALPLPLPHF